MRMEIEHKTSHKEPLFCRDNGVEWIGKIPVSWQVKKIKFIFREKNIRSATGQETLLSLSKYFGLIPRAELTDKDEAANSLVNYKICTTGDLVINKLQAWNGMLDISNYYGLVSPDYAVYTAIENVDLKYFKYLFQTRIYVDEFAKRSSGIGDGFFRLYTQSFYDIYAIYPPIDEQARISEFLDRKAGQIDKAIAQKEKLIQLLKERRQILIHNAVTKGLNLNAKMKDSGVVWIGAVPEHWQVKRLKFLCHITTGTRNTEDKVENGKYPFFVRSQTPERINTYTFDGEAILTAGDGAGVGKVFHYVNGKFDFHQRVYKFSLFKEVQGFYLFHYIQANFANVALLGTAKSTVDSLRLPLIQDFLVCYPSREEQEEIVRHIENINTKIELSTSSLQLQIEKLKEYKATLINNAVTGKIKL